MFPLLFAFPFQRDETFSAPQLGGQLPPEHHQSLKVTGCFVKILPDSFWQSPLETPQDSKFCICVASHCLHPSTGLTSWISLCFLRFEETPSSASRSHSGDYQSTVPDGSVPVVPGTTRATAIGTQNLQEYTLSFWGNHQVLSVLAISLAQPSVWIFGYRWGGTCLWNHAVPVIEARVLCIQTMYDP